MTRQEREAVAQRICNFYIDASNKSVKTTVNYFMKQGFPRQTIYNIINKYLKYGQTTFLPRTGRPLKLSNRKLNQLVKCVNNRYGVSQRKLAYRFGVNQSTISRNLRQRTPIVIRKRRKAPQMNNQEQAKRAQRNCGKLYKTIPRDWNIILDDEKYFSLTNSDIGGNRFYYSTDPEETPIHIRFKQKKKFEPKLMIWMVMSSKGVSEIYIHESNQAVRQEIYLDEYNPPNVPQARPIETLWAHLAQKVYENNWKAKDLSQLASRIKRKVKELNQDTLQHMVRDVRKKLRQMWRDGLYSVY